MLQWTAYKGHAVTGGDIDDPGTPGGTEGTTLIDVKASSLPYYDAAKPPPDSYAEPPGNRWCRIRVGVNGTFYGTFVYVEADKYQNQWATIRFEVPLDIRLIQSVQVQWDNDWSGDNWTVAGQDRNLAVESITIDPEDEAVTLGYAVATYVGQPGPGYSAGIEAAARDVEYRNGYFDFRTAGAALGNTGGSVPTTEAVLRRNGNKLQWRGADTVLFGPCMRIWQAFDVATGHPVWSDAVRDQIYAEIKKIKDTLGANHIRAMIAPGEYQYWNHPDRGARFWSFVTGFADRCLQEDMFLDIAYWVVGDMGGEHADDSWAASEYRTGWDFYDTSEAVREQFFTEWPQYFKTRGWVSASLQDEPIRRVLTGGTAQSGGSTTTIKLAAGASSVDNFYQFFRIYITGGTGNGAQAIISSYNGSDKIATIYGTWPGATPTAGSTYVFEDTFARIQPAQQRLVNIIRGQGAKNFLTPGFQHYCRDGREFLTTHPIIDAENNIGARYHEFGSWQYNPNGPLEDYVGFLTSGGVRIDHTYPLHIGGTGYYPQSNSTPPPAYLDLKEDHWDDEADIFDLWDWSMVNDGMLASGYPQNLPPVLTPSGTWFRDHKPLGNRLRPSSGAGAGSPPTSPPPPPGVVVDWTPIYDANLSEAHYVNPVDSATVTKDGSNNVSAIADQGGMDKDLAKYASGGFPAWDDDGINGYPSIYFDGSAKALQVDLGLTIQGDELTYMILAQPETGLGVYGVVGALKSSDESFAYNNLKGALPVGNDNNAGFVAQRNSVKTTAQALNLGAPSFWIVTWDGTNVTVRRNGQQVAQTAQTGDFSFEQVAYGSNWNADTAHWKGWLGMQWFEPHVRSLSDLERFEGYIMHRYGITSLLPSGHTYKTNPPKTTSTTPSPPTTSPPPPSPPATTTNWGPSNFEGLANGWFLNPWNENSVTKGQAMAITAAADSSGVQRSLSLVNANLKPTFGTFIGGKGSIRFPGGASYGLKGSCSFQGQHVTMIGLFQPQSSNPAGAMAVTIRDTSKTYAWDNIESAHLLDFSGTGWHTVRDELDPGTVPASYGSPFIYTVIFASTQQIVRLNGAQVWATNQLGTFSAESIAFGCADGAFNNAKIDMGPVFVYDGNMGIDDVKRWEAWLAWEAGLQSILDAGHTYKSARPTVTGSSPPPPSPPSSPPPTTTPPAPSNTNLFARDRARRPMYERPDWLPDPATTFTKQIFLRAGGNDGASGTSYGNAVASPSVAITKMLALGPGAEIIISADRIWNQSMFIPQNNPGWWRVRGDPSGPRPLFRCGPRWTVFETWSDKCWVEYLELDGSRVGHTMEDGTFIGSEEQWWSWMPAHSQNTWGSVNGSGCYWDATWGNQSARNAGKAGQYGAVMRDIVAYRFPQSGGGPRQWDLVLFEDNLIFENCRGSRYGPSGMTALEPYFNGPGSSSHRMIWRRNVIFNCIQDQISTFDNNGTTVKDGNGILSDRFNVYGYTGRALYEANLVIDNGANGIGVLSGKNVDLFSNTIVGNMRHPDRSGAGEMLFYFQANDGAQAGCKAFSNVAWAQTNRKALAIFQAPAPAFGNNVLWGNGGVEMSGPSDRVAQPIFIDSTQNMANRSPYRYRSSFDMTRVNFQLRPDSPGVGLAHPTYRASRDILGNLPPAAPCSGCFFYPG